MKTLAQLSLALLIAAAAQAQETRTVVALPMPAATLDELAATPFPETSAGEIHRHHRGALPRAEEAFTFPGAIAPSATIGAPAVGTSFMDESEPSRFYPADAGGAVSATYVVGMCNKSLSVRDRSGNSLKYLTLSTFWQKDGYDPHLVYDAANNRWVAVSLYDQNYNNSTLLVAISDSGDPTGTWHRYSLLIDPTSATWGDFPRLALSQSMILITANRYRNNTNQDPVGADLYTVSKTTAYSTPATLPLTQSSTADFELTPVAVFDAGNTSNWFVESDSTGLRVYDTTSRTKLQSYPAPIAMSDQYALTVGEQLGSASLMDAGDAVPQYALIRNGKLWEVQTFTTLAADHTGILVWSIDLASQTAKNWVIEDTTAATSYAFPSIAVNKNGAAVVAYNEYNAAIYPSAAFTYIAPNGDSSAPSLLKSGQAPYTISRWADFSTTVVDPLDDSGFWTVQALPLKPTTSQVWSTWWINVPAPSAPTGPVRHRAARH